MHSLVDENDSLILSSGSYYRVVTAKSDPDKLLLQYIVITCMI